MNILRRGLQNFINSIKLSSAASNGYTVRFLSTDNHVSYDEFIGRRRAEANRSIVIQVNSEKSFPELYNYCSDFGAIIDAYHYCIYHEDMHYILIEYSTEEEAMRVINSASYNEDFTGIPVHSPFLWFKAESRQKSKRDILPVPKPLKIIEGTRTIENEELNKLMRSASDIEEQIKILHHKTSLNDLGVRLRFLAAKQIESSISGMFPEANAQLFGSSVNGFGKMGCDLDLILRFDRNNGKREEINSRLIFHTKENLSNGRSQTQRQMESIGDMIQLFLPGVCHVRRILQARIPIIKYHHEHLNLEVDLSMSNLSGAYMSELLYMFGEFDEHVRPLVFSIRRWAQACGLTNPSPGRWISNFSLTCLVIFFLQQLKQPILPSINLLMKLAKPNDIRMTEDGISCTFCRDMRAIPFKKKNTNNLSELLMKFFEFYSQFDFNDRAISLNEGRAITKPEYSALHIVNPLEQVLNVSKNVSVEECERLRTEVRNAAWILESDMESNSLTELERLDATWGLLNLFKPPDKPIIRPTIFVKRMVEVSQLFANESANYDDHLKVNYKNDSSRKEVSQIRSQAKSDLKQIRMNATAAATATASAPATTAAPASIKSKMRKR